MATQKAKTVSDDTVRGMAQTLAKAWADDSFKRRLIAEPHAVLKAHGVEVPAGTRVRIVEDTPGVRHFILPEKPKNGTDLNAAAASAEAYSINFSSMCACISRTSTAKKSVTTSAKKSAAKPTGGRSAAKKSTATRPAAKKRSSTR
jgi:hypothetical protein